MTHLSPRDRRALWLGAAVVLTVLGLSRGVPEIRAWTVERQSSAAELISEVHAARADIAGQRQRKQALRNGSESLAVLQAGLVRGATPVSAAAALAQLVRSAADSAAVHVQSTQVRADTTRSGASFAVVSVRIDATADVRGLTSLLARIERGPALLVVRSLAVSQPDPSAEMEALRVEMVVEALAGAESRQRLVCDCSGEGCPCNTQAGKDA